jgi:uncharacterized membrane protein
MILAGWRAWMGDRWATAVLLLLAVAWLRIDKRFEGPVLVHLTGQHGIVLSDLAAVAAVVVVALAGWRHRHAWLPRDQHAESR